MKAAILNYHNAYNYGAVFQAAALQYVVNTLGAECDIIDYRNEAVENQYTLCKMKLNKSLFRKIRHNLTLVPFINAKKRNFQNWIDSYQKTQRVNREQLSQLSEQYDKIIVGSDQVWNMGCHNDDTSYLLDFVGDDNKKIAYAASFGAYNFLPEYESIFKQYLPKFAHISAREKRGAELVKRITGQTPLCTMDPVLLAGKSYWKTRMSDRTLGKAYIFVYHLGHGKGVSSMAHRLKKQLGLPIIYVTAHSGNLIYYSLMDKNKSDVSPEGFLSLLSNAAYVITNSFHGTALSILFHKEFCSVVKGDEKATYNSRIYNLLNDYHLLERVCDPAHECPLQKINYSDVDSLLEKERNTSLAFLKNSIFSNGDVS